MGAIPVLCLLLSLSAAVFPAQQCISQAGAVEQAQRLRDGGQLGAAADALRSHLATNPDDGDAARLLAQTLYWLKDVAGAQAIYEDALVRHPEDTSLRLQYARMLVETGRHARARQLLAPLTQLAATQADAQTLLGTLAYWDGDLTNAQRLFAQALAANPNQQDARRQLREIASLTASWIRFSSGLRHDDQPLDRVQGALEAKWSATPLAAITVNATPAGFWLPNAATRNLWDASVSFAGYAPAAKLETDVGIGVVRRSFGEKATAWQGHASVGVRASRAVTLTFRARRTPYLYTTASLTTPVMTDAVAGILHLSSAGGWLGEAAYEQQRYPDDNSVTTAYGWLLAPLVHRRGNEFQIGYAVASDDSDHLRFVLANPRQPYLPGDPRFDLTGVYDPYYTPASLVSHSAIAALAVRASAAATFRAGGSIAVRATEQAPAFLVSAGQVLLETAPRTFTPWSARASLDVNIGAATLAIGAEFGQTAFYRWTTAGVSVTRRFTRTDAGR